MSGGIWWPSSNGRTSDCGSENESSILFDHLYMGKYA